MWRWVWVCKCALCKIKGVGHDKWARHHLLARGKKLPRPPSRCRILCTTLLPVPQVFNFVWRQKRHAQKASCPSDAKIWFFRLAFCLQALSFMRPIWCTAHCRVNCLSFPFPQFTFQMEENMCAVGKELCTNTIDGEHSSFLKKIPRHELFLFGQNRLTLFLYFVYYI